MRKKERKKERNKERNKREGMWTHKKKEKMCDSVGKEMKMN